MPPRNARGQSSIALTAAFSVAIFVLVALWQGISFVKTAHSTSNLVYERPGETNPPEKKLRISLDMLRGDTQNSLNVLSAKTAATSSDPLSNLTDFVAQQFVSSYAALKASGRLSTDTVAAVGATLGESIKAPSQFIAHAAPDLITTPDTSLERVLAYRSDMRVALASLISPAEPEFAIFARYVETKDPRKILELQKAVERYRTAELAALLVPVPKDAAPLHLRVVNSLGAFADSINELIRFADDPITSVAILRTYNDGEREMLDAFNALSAYYVRKSTER